MQNRNMNAYNKTLRGLAASASALALAGLLAGCGGAMSNAGGTTGTGGGGPLVRYTGNVHGGQQPVAGSTIQLYTVGTGGLKSASAPLLPTSPAVTSDANGNFTITGLVNCASATQVYIVATQGNPGTGANSALSMMAALGPCASLGTTTTFIQINELSTVAAAYALAPFAQDYAHVGASGSNPAGLVNAFATAGVCPMRCAQTRGNGLSAICRMMSCRSCWRAATATPRNCRTLLGPCLAASSPVGSAHRPLATTCTIASNLGISMPARTGRHQRATKNVVVCVATMPTSP